MFLASNAFQAGSLAASQPALALVDPIVASALGVVLFGERIDLRPAALLGELTAVSVVVMSVIALSRSPLIHAYSGSTDASARRARTPPARHLEGGELAFQWRMRQTGGTSTIGYGEDVPRFGMEE
jgi:hypothetical protein